MQFDKNSKFLVTGASEFIGSKLVELLLENDVQIFSLVRTQKSANPNSKIVLGDLADPKFSVPDENFDVVFHLASHTPLEKNKKILENVNYNGTKNLFRAVKNKTKSIVYVSGLAIFDSKNIEINEDSPINPDTLFTQLRVKAEEFLAEECKNNNIRYSTAYVGDVVYGMVDSSNLRY